MLAQQQQPPAGEQQEVEDSEFVNPCAMVSQPAAPSPPTRSTPPPLAAASATATERTAMDIIDEQPHTNPVHEPTSESASTYVSGTCTGTPRGEAALIALCAQRAV